MNCTPNQAGLNSKVVNMVNYENDHFKREEMILRLAHYFKLSKAEDYRNLEPEIKALWGHHPYINIVRPLVRYDRYNKEMSYKMLSIRYDITIRQVRRMINGR